MLSPGQIALYAGEAAAADVLTHDGVAVDVSVSGDSAPGALVVSHAGVAVNVGVAGDTSYPVDALAHSGVAVEVGVAATWAVGALTVAHAGVAVNVGVGLLTLTQGAVTLTLITDDMIVGYEPGVPFTTFDVEELSVSFVTKEPFLVP